MANMVIKAFYDFFLSIGIPTHLKDVGVKEDKIEEMADHILKYDSTNEKWMFYPLDKDALIRILKNSM